MCKASTGTANRKGKHDGVRQAKTTIRSDLNHSKRQGIGRTGAVMKAKHRRTKGGTWTLEGKHRKGDGWADAKGHGKQMAAWPTGSTLSSRCTRSIPPSSAAACRGVTPPSAAKLTSAPASTSAFTASKFPVSLLKFLGRLI